MKTPPAQLFLVFLQLAQSVSEETFRESMSPPAGSQTPWFAVPLRYRARRRKEFIPDTVGSFISFVSSRTACCTSGRSKER